jgi:hypothetical protein
MLINMLLTIAMLSTIACPLVLTAVELVLP